MAFKILSESELNLLTEEQRNSYEKRLIAYQKRSEFVDMVEQFGNVSGLEYETKVKPIVIIDPKETRGFKPVKYGMKMDAAIVKPKTEFGEYSPADVDVKMPKKSKCELPKIQNFEIPDSKVELDCDVVKPSVKVTEIQMPQYEVALDLAVDKANVTERMFEMPDSAIKMDVNFSKPETYDGNFELSQKEVKLNVELKKVSVNSHEFKMPENDIKLDVKTKRPSVHVNSFEIPETKLQMDIEVNKPEVKAPVFDASQLKKPELPKVSVDFKEINNTFNIENKTPKLPDVKVPEMSKEYKFSKAVKPANAELVKVAEVKIPQVKTMEKIVKKEVPAPELPQMKIYNKQYKSVMPKRSEMPKIEVKGAPMPSKELMDMFCKA